MLNKDQHERLMKICERENKSPYAIAKKLLLELIEKEAKDVESGRKETEPGHSRKDRKLDELDQ